MVVVLMLQRSHENRCCSTRAVRARTRGAARRDGTDRISHCSQIDVTCWTCTNSTLLLQVMLNSHTHVTLVTQAGIAPADGVIHCHLRWRGLKLTPPWLLRFFGVQPIKVSQEFNCAGLSAFHGLSYRLRCVSLSTPLSRNGERVGLRYPHLPTVRLVLQRNRTVFGQLF